MFNKIYFALILITLPVFSYAQDLEKTKTLLESADDIVRENLIPLAFTSALLFFFWGMAKYIRSAGDDKEEGRKIMIWGIIALTVMTAVWGLVYFITTEIGLDEQGTIKIPTIEKVS